MAKVKRYENSVLFAIGNGGRFSMYDRIHTMVIEDTKSKKIYELKGSTAVKRSCVFFYTKDKCEWLREGIISYRVIGKDYTEITSGAIWVRKEDIQ